MKEDLDPLTRRLLIDALKFHGQDLLDVWAHADRGWWEPNAYQDTYQVDRNAGVTQWRKEKEGER